MSIRGNTDGPETDSILGVTSPIQQNRVNYRVILEGVKEEIETPESFAIKFSILVRVPITKVKHLIRNVPVTVWTGHSKSRAKRLVSLIDESGGIGRMVEDFPSPDKESPKPAKTDHPFELVCHRCGFPIKEGDKYCDFCMTPVGEKEHHNNKTFQGKVKRKKPVIPPYRLLLYLVILFVGIVLLTVFR